MPALPQLKSHDLIQQFNALSRSRRLDEFSMTRFRREIEKLRSVDASTAASLAGMLAAQEGNVDEMNRQNQLAIRLKPSDVAAHANYSICLFELGFLSKAFEQVHEAHKIEPANVRIFNQLVDFGLAASQFSRVLDLLERNGSMERQQFEKQVASAGDFLKLIHEHSLSEVDVSEFEEYAGSVLRKNGALLDGVEFKIQEDEEDRWLSARCNILGDVDQVVQLNWQLALGLAESSALDRVARYVNVMFVVAELA